VFQLSANNVADEETTPASEAHCTDDTTKQS